MEFESCMPREVPYHQANTFHLHQPWFALIALQDRVPPFPTDDALRVMEAGEKPPKPLHLRPRIFRTRLAYLAYHDTNRSCFTYAAQRYWSRVQSMRIPKASVSALANKVVNSLHHIDTIPYYSRPCLWFILFSQLGPLLGQVSLEGVNILLQGNNSLI